MGKRGPKATKPNLNLLRGNPGKRRIPTEPTTLADLERPLGDEEPPDWLNLDDAAAEQWRRVAPALIAEGVLTVIDHMAFGLLCQSWSYWQQAAREVDERGVVIEHANGCLGANPAVAIAKQWRECVIAGAKDFGLTPPARDRIDLQAAHDAAAASLARDSYQEFRDSKPRPHRITPHCDPVERDDG
jgi:P27 family predicted phage terminase small subunit